MKFAPYMAFWFITLLCSFGSFSFIIVYMVVRFVRFCLIL